MEELATMERESIRAFVESCAEHFTGRVLDYGAGRSPYRDVVTKAGGEYHAYDRSRFGGNVSGRDLGDHPSDGTWDALLVNQVDEYVMDIDALFAHFYRLLKPAGNLVMTGPTNWPEIRDDLRRMTLLGVRHVASRAGFRITHLESRGCIGEGAVAFSIGWRLSAVRSRHLVYGLTCPFTGTVRYVGQTAQAPPRRLAQHIGAARNEWKRQSEQKHLWNWIRSLGEDDPEIVVLESDPDDIDAAERRWIGKFRNEGARLCNMTNGGNGRARGYKHSAAEVERRRARRATPETRAKMSAAQTGKKRPPEFRERMREIALARPKRISDEAVAAIRSSTEPVRVLAERHGISTSYVYAIRRSERRPS